MEGNTIRSLRDKRGMTQQDLAVAAGMPLSVLARIERGESRPRIDTAQRIAAALKTTVDKLFPPAKAAR